MQYLAGPIEIVAIDGQVVAFVVFDFFIEFLVDWIGVEDKRGEVWKA